MDAITDQTPLPPPFPAELLTEARPCQGLNAPLFTTPDAFEEEAPNTRVAREARARLLCASCPVRSACLTYAMEAEPTDGVWGGLTAAEIAALSETGMDEVA